MNSRKLEFRVWDKRSVKGWHTEKMLYSAEQSSLWKDFLDYPETYVITQNTSLKDSCGKHIYEGDILRFKAPLGEQESYLMRSLKQVRYSLDIGGDFPFAGFCAISLNPTDLEVGASLDCINAQNCEVIGNIFENPELLKQ